MHYQPDNESRFFFLQDDVIKWKHFPRYCLCVWGIHRSPVNSPHKHQRRGALMIFSLICAWTNRWVNNRDTGDLRHHRAHYDVIVMLSGPHCVEAARPKRKGWTPFKILSWPLKSWCPPQSGRWPSHTSPSLKTRGNINKFGHFQVLFRTICNWKRCCLRAISCYQGQWA